jgi:hypothetical protein
MPEITTQGFAQNVREASDIRHGQSRWGWTFDIAGEENQDPRAVRLMGDSVVGQIRDDYEYRVHGTEDAETNEIEADYAEDLTTKSMVRAHGHRPHRIHEKGTWTGAAEKFARSPRGYDFVISNGGLHAVAMFGIEAPAREIIEGHTYEVRGEQRDGLIFATTARDLRTNAIVRVKQFPMWIIWTAVGTLLAFVLAAIVFVVLSITEVINVNLY